jgi:hypothetical protein
LFEKKNVECPNNSGGHRTLNRGDLCRSQGVVAPIITDTHKAPGRVIVWRSLWRVRSIKDRSPEFGSEILKPVMGAARPR